MGGKSSRAIQQATQPLRRLASLREEAEERENPAQLYAHMGPASCCWNSLSGGWGGNSLRSCGRTGRKS